MVGMSDSPKAEGFIHYKGMVLAKMQYLSALCVSLLLKYLQPPLSPLLGDKHYTCSHLLTTPYYPSPAGLLSFYVQPQFTLQALEPLTSSHSIQLQFYCQADHFRSPRTPWGWASFSAASAAAREESAISGLANQRLSNGGDERESSGFDRIEEEERRTNRMRMTATVIATTVTVDLT